VDALLTPRWGMCMSLVPFWRSGRLTQWRGTREYFHLGEGLALTRLKNGQFIFVDPLEESVCAKLIARGVWERHTTKVVLSLLQAGDHVVEVGAHVGYYTLAMALKVGHTGSVTSLEANPRLASLAERTLRFNGCAGWARVMRKAASDVAGPVRFSISRQFGGGGHLYVWDGALGDDTEILEVDAVRLDDLNMPPPRLIRLDAEGSEILILRGAERLLARKDVVLCMEWDVIQMASRGDPDAFANWLADKGFRFWRIQTNGRLVGIATADLATTPRCDLVIARSPTFLPSKLRA